MSADELRQAAETLRKRVDAATPGPWTLIWDSCDCADGYGCSHGSWVHAIRFPVPVQEPIRPGGEVLSHHYESGVDEVPPETVEYIATMHPGVGLALADWLDTAGADLWAYGPLCECGSGCHECDDSLWEPHVRRALTLARLINGGAS